MIKVEKVIKKRLSRCLSCNADEKVLDVSIGINENQTTIIVLCVRCIADLNEQTQGKIK